MCTVFKAGCQEWTTEHERGFLRALAALKARDPRIYKSDEQFFVPKEGPKEQQSAKQRDGKSKQQSSKLTLQEYERKLATERGGSAASAILCIYEKLSFADN